MLRKARSLLREGQVEEAAVPARRLPPAPGDLLSFAQELWEAGAQEDALVLAIDEHLSENRLVRVAEAATPTHPFGAIAVYKRLVRVRSGTVLALLPLSASPQRLAECRGTRNRKGML